TRTQLDLERRRFQDLFELAPEAYLVTDPEGVVVEANRMAARLLNVPQRFISGKVLANFVPELGRRAFRAALWDRAHGRGGTRLRFRIQPRRGEAIAVEASVGPGAARAGRGTELVWILRDLVPRDHPED